MSISPRVLSFRLTVKRLPFTDHIVVLDHEGKLSEQGNFDDLNSTGGYVSSFSLGLPDLDCKPVKPAPPYASRGQLWSVEEPEDKGGEKSDSSDGDIAIYLYYIRSIGWFSTLVFLVAISAFAFGLSFPSMSSLHTSGCRHLADLVEKVSGLSGGPAQIQKMGISTLVTTLEYMQCSVSLR